MPEMSEPARFGTPLLVFSRFFWPGFKGGGPVQSMTALVQWLGDRLDIHLVTRDRDLGDVKPFPVVENAYWTRLDGVTVRYAHEPKMGTEVPRAMRALPRYRLVLNNVFNPIFSVLPLLVCRVVGRRIERTFIFPRGEMDPGALRQSSGRKRVFLATVKRSGLWRGVTWIATSEMERENVLRILPKAKVEVAENLVPRSKLSLTQRVRPEKRPGTVRLAFASRISPKKGMLPLLEALATATGDIELDVAGPVSDNAYWQRCLAVVPRLPPNVQFRYLGEIPNQELLERIQEYHFTILPTRSENYGHSVVESFLASVPVLLTDATPWTWAVEEGAGLLIEDIPETLAEAVAMDAESYTEVCDATDRVKQAIRTRVADEAERLFGILTQP